MHTYIYNHKYICIFRLIWTGKKSKTLSYEILLKIWNAEDKQGRESFA